MATRKSGLGKNLNALLGGSANLVVKQTEATGEKLTNLTVKQLSPGKYQPRVVFNEQALEELATSIRKQGIIQPLVVRQIAPQKYEIIAGERRWRAAQLAGLSEVPVVIKDISDESAVAIALIENLQREDLNPIEQARALARLANEFALTHQQIAEVVGKSRTAVTNILRLMSLSKAVQQELEDGNLEMGHARALLSLPIEQQGTAANIVITKKMTVRETEQWVKRFLSEEPENAAKQKIQEPWLKDLSAQLSQQLNSKVMFKHKANGKGRLIIDYKDINDLLAFLSE